MTTDSSWLILWLVLLLAWLTWTWWRPSASHWDPVTVRVQRLLKSRTPDDCPACRQPAVRAVAHVPTRPPVIPWPERKSRRGAPKRITTQGFACPNRGCDYYQITDAQIHALVGDGREGRHERIQTLRCQACQTTFSSRRDTPSIASKRQRSRWAKC